MTRLFSRSTPSRRDVVLTGIPRSGTTLACVLLNGLENVVALDESVDFGERLTRGSHRAISDRIARAFSDARRCILATGTTVSRHVGGVLATNHAGDEVGPSGFREPLTRKGPIVVDKPLDPDFLLVIKHPAPFTALIETLSARFPSYAVIRNPLAVLGSWNSVAMPFRDGHAPNAERLDAGLRTALASIPDRAERQIHLLSWFFAQYERVLPPSHVIRYEDLVATGGKALVVVAPGAVGLSQALASRNRSALYDRDELRGLGRRLLEREGAFWRYYSREEVQAVAEGREPRESRSRVEPADGAAVT